MTEKQQRFSAAAILVIILAIGGVGGAGYTVYKKQNDKKIKEQKAQSISSFEECVAAGNPVAESYPEQCIANGKTFVNSQQQIGSISCNSDEETKNWKAVSSKSKKFMVCVPDGWKVTNDLAEDRIIGYGPELTYKKGQLATIENHAIDSFDGTPAGIQIFLADASYVLFVTDSATRSKFALNDGTQAVRYYEKVGKQTGEGIGPVEGQLIYEYQLEKNNQGLRAVYVVDPGQKNDVAIAEKALKTLRF